MLVGMIGEVEQIARAKGIALPTDIAAATLDKVRQFPPETKTSLQLDFEKGRETEIEAITGEVIRRGRKHGIPTPVNDVLYGLVKARSGMRRQPPSTR